MDLSSLLHWWDEWQLSVLVLGSLGVRCFLAVAAAARKSRIGPVYRFFIWLSYLGGDALAIYALAALLNIQKKATQEQESSDRGSRALQLLWAPIMLMHLGGLANISAYNIEDNELWRRHIATSLSQVAVALYVFCKQWSSSADKRLLTAAILLFIPGVFKCFEKPLALRRSSFYNLVSKPSSRQKKGEDSRPSKPSCSFHSIVSQPSTKENLQQNNKSPADGDPADLEDYINTAQIAFAKPDKIYPNDREILKCLSLSRPDKLFVDLARTYSERARDLESFWRLQDGADQTVISIGISNTFNLLYTKDFTLDQKGRDEHTLDLICSFSTWVLCLLVPIAAIGLLHSGRTEAYRGSDVKITFVLLYLTLFADACSIFLLNLNDSHWHGMVAQHNLMALFAKNRRRRPPWLARAAGLLGCTELLDQLFFHMEPCNSSGQTGITSAVRCHVQDGWKEYIDIKNAESYSRFIDMRGQWTLRREKCDMVLGESSALGRQFDEAVLIWHLATDMCLPSLRKSKDSENKDVTLATQISNYMMHLLFFNPEMQMPGSRRELCILAYKEMERIFKNEDEEERRRTQNKTQESAHKKEEEKRDENKRPENAHKNKEEENAAAAVADRLLGHKFSSPQDDGIVFIYAAWQLAHALKGLGDKEKAWRVIRGVWVEMLCYSAIRCRGYLHAKSLGSGGEYLTFVWLLMAHAGLETFPERQQRPRTMPPPSDQPPAAAAAQSSAPLQN